MRLVNAIRGETWEHLLPNILPTNGTTRENETNEVSEEVDSRGFEPRAFPVPGG